MCVDYGLILSTSQTLHINSIRCFSTVSIGAVIAKYLTKTINMQHKLNWWDSWGQPPFPKGRRKEKIIKMKPPSHATCSIVSKIVSNVSKIFYLIFEKLIFVDVTRAAIQVITFLWPCYYDLLWHNIIAMILYMKSKVMLENAQIQMAALL
jgi:hypothetical protein